VLNIDWDFTHSLEQLSEEERQGTPSFRLHSQAAAAGLVTRVMAPDGTLTSATGPQGNTEVPRLTPPPLPNAYHKLELTPANTEGRRLSFALPCP